MVQRSWERQSSLQWGATVVVLQLSVLRDAGRGIWPSATVRLTDLRMCGCVRYTARTRGTTA